MMAGFQWELTVKFIILSNLRGPIFYYYDLQLGKCSAVQGREQQGEGLPCRVPHPSVAVDWAAYKVINKAIGNNAYQ